MKRFAPPCYRCMQPILDDHVSAFGHDWHQCCFVCCVSAYIIFYLHCLSANQNTLLILHRTPVCTNLIVKLLCLVVHISNTSECQNLQQIRPEEYVQELTVLCQLVAYKNQLMNFTENNRLFSAIKNKLVFNTLSPTHKTLAKWVFAELMSFRTPGLQSHST